METQICAGTSTRRSHSRAVSVGTTQLYSLPLPLPLLLPPGWEALCPLHPSPVAMDHGSDSVIWPPSWGAGLISSDVGGYLVSKHTNIVV